MSPIQPNPDIVGHVTPSRRAGPWTAVAVVFMFLLALAIRLIRLDEPPRDFWTVRQYYVPMLAQALYFEGMPDLPPWRQELVRAHKAAFQGREPPIMERVGVLIYRGIGHFALWPLRIQPVLAWIAGGVFLFLTARRLVGARAATVGAAYYLFLPYGVTASRSLQPDSMMVGALLAAVWTMVHYHEKPGWGRWAACVAASGLAILVKPGISQFAVSATYLALAIERTGWRAAIKDVRNYLFYVGAALPAAVYMLKASNSAGGLGMYLDWNFKPVLLLTLYFWKGWLGILIRMLGLAAVFLAGWGFLRPPTRKAGAVMLGFGLGYLAQCFFTIVATASHDYWHLQVIPLVALGVACAAVRIFAVVERAPPAWAKRAGVWALAALWALWSVRTTFAEALRPTSSAYPQDAKEIGAAVGHSTKTIILDHDMGYPLMYFADIYGREWPVSQAMRFAQAVDVDTDREAAELSAAERYERHYAAAGFEFFIVSRALSELDVQPGLRDLLYGRFELVASGPRYLIFDLRERKTP